MMTLGADVTRADGTTYVPGSVALMLNKFRFNISEPGVAHADLQAWMEDAFDVSDKSAEEPFVPTLEEGETTSAFTTEDILYVHDQVIDLASMTASSANTANYVYEGVLYSRQTMFFGGSGGVDITHLGQVFNGAFAFSADQMQYDSAPPDGNITVFAGIVSQGCGQHVIAAPRVPSGDNMYTVNVNVSSTAVNSAMKAFAFAYNSDTGAVAVMGEADAQAKAALSDVLFDTRHYARNERQDLAEAALMALTDQIASDVPDEFRSGTEAMMRLGLNVEIIDSLMTSTASSTITQDQLLHALVTNILETSWNENDTYTAYGSGLLRNIILGTCSMNTSRIHTDHIQFEAGDEVVFYITFTGTIRVGASSVPERFGLSSNEIEHPQTNLDAASWIKLVVRIVR